MLLCYYDRGSPHTAWFFMLRAQEYCESNGVDYAMILRAWT